MRRLFTAVALSLLPTATLLPPGPAAADPADIEAALTAAPASLMDLSLARLESLLQADGISGGYYGWVYLQDDQINISAWSLTQRATEPGCKALIDRLKRLAAVDPETGFPDDPASRFASFFSYPKLDEFAIDPSYMETVDSMIVLSVEIGVAGDGKAVSCKSPLLSKDVSYAWE